MAPERQKKILPNSMPRKMPMLILRDPNQSFGENKGGKYILPVELAGEEPVEGEGGDHWGEERGIETWSHIVKVKCGKSKDFELQKK